MSFFANKYVIAGIRMAEIIALTILPALDVYKRQALKLLSLQTVCQLIFYCYENTDSPPVPILFQDVYKRQDLSTILETIVDAGSTTRDMDMITEQVRGALSRTITRKFCQNGQLRVVTLDADVETKILAALTKNDHGVYLALSPDIMQQIIAQLGELRKKFNELSQTPILLTSQVIRVYVSRMVSQFYPDMYVLSFNEITSNVQIQAIGNVSLGAQPKQA